MLTFGDWLATTIQDRGWTQSELARRASISQATLSRLINETRQPGPDVCLSLARVLNIPPESVFKQAGLLPPDPAPVTQEKEALALFRRLPDLSRQLILTQLRALAGTASSHSRTSQAGIHAVTEDTPEYQPDPLTTQLLHQFQQLPEHWQQEAIREIQRLQRYADQQVRIIGDPDDTP